MNKIFLRVKGHKLQMFTTTIRNSGSHITTGKCICGWVVECTVGREVRSFYYNHLIQEKQLKSGMK